MPSWLRRLPPLPWRMALAALTAKLVLQGSVLSWLPAGLTPWLACLDELLLSYTTLLLVAWVLVDVPTALALWRQPPRILRDLTLILLGTAITVVVVQQQIRINLFSLVTASAVLTAVIGLAAQETLKDLFAGITLQLDPPFKLGDWIALGESKGVVNGFTLMNTVIVTADGSDVVLPNSFVAQEHLTRRRSEDPLGVQFAVAFDCHFPPAEAQQLLLRVLHNNSRVLCDPPPCVWVDAFAESSIVYQIIAYQAGSPDFPVRDLRSTLMLEIWYALRRKGQSLPYPVRQLLRPVQPTSQINDLTNASMADRIAALELNPLFSSLDQRQLQQLACLTRTQVYAPGEAVVVEGDNDDDLYQVLSGSLGVSRMQPGTGQEIRVASLKEGDLFGEMSLLLDAPRSATVRALGQVVLLQVNRADLAPLLEADPDLFEVLAAVVKQRRQILEQYSLDHNQDHSSDILSKMKQLFKSVLTAT